MAKKIKYGICEWSLPWSGKFGFQFAKELGFDGVQIDLGPYQYDLPLSKEKMQDAYMDASAKYGLEIPSMTVQAVNNEHTMTATPGLRDFYLAVDALKKAVDACERMGINIIMPPHFYQNVMVTEEDVRRTALAYKEVCAYAAPKGITFASENAMTREEFLRFKELAGNPENFGIYFDTQNYWKHKGYYVPDLYRQLKDFCVPQIHIKDGKGIISSAILGEGDSKFFETAEAIKESGFEGWIILENYYDQSLLAEQNHNPWELIEKDLEIAKSIFG